MDHNDNNQISVPPQQPSGNYRPGLSESMMPQPSGDNFQLGQDGQPQQGLPKMPKNKKPEIRSSQEMVKKWTNKIRSAKKKYEPDFERMKDNMEFVYGIQWPGQEDLEDDRYVANVVMREINQGVASLYARNPKATAERRDMLDYTVWDGTPETLIQAAQSMLSGQLNPLAMQIIEDFLRVETDRQMVDRVADSLEKLYALEMDRQEPNFKLAMKQLVRRVKVCGVGYVRAAFKREERLLLTPSLTYEDVPSRAKKLAMLVQDYEEKKFDQDNSKVEEIKMLVNSLNYTFSNPPERRETVEKLVFDFPAATSIIVDPCCRMLKGFVSAKWVVQEYCMPLEEVRSFFECPELNAGGGEGQAKSYTGASEELANAQQTTATGDAIPIHVLVWEVFDKIGRDRFFICDGWKNFLLEPEDPKPCVQRFWHHMAITFNDTEVEPGIQATIYPPSDIDLMRHPQLEINRARQMRREHRRRNRPATVSAAGALTNEDKVILKSDYPTGANVEVRGLNPGQNVSDVIQAMPQVKMEPMLYETNTDEHDIQLVVGAQQAVLGPIPSKGTATAASISEQSRMTTTSSNVDDLDDLLTEMAEVGGEMLLRERSIDSVKMDIGAGAVWPMPGNRDRFVSRIYLKVAAASSGRPNKGLEIANFERLAPLFMNLLQRLPPQEGAQLAVFMIREAVKRLDDRIDLANALPLVNTLRMLLPSGGGPTPMSQPSGDGGSGSARGSSPQRSSNSNETPNGSPPMPIAAQNSATTANMNPS